MVEKVYDPLIHLVRNALDHGIESPEKRKQSGKPSQGQLTLKASHDSGQIVIEVMDDGQGIDPQMLREAAEQSGRLDSGEILSEEQLFQLVFEPGFSTHREADHLSGRGVGMDVVKGAVEGLRGSVALYSEQGVGTRVTLRLPLTVAIIDGFLVDVCGSSYVIPLSMVDECIELEEQDRQSQLENQYFNLRGSWCPTWIWGSFSRCLAIRERRGSATW
ncbi:chemotaxis protein CheA [Dongshaea marina]|uniref:chemotaxis protein CheA n=1 Tax=Dongshaea marina TaxID=2047966 RepID=UPI000D3E4A8B|nr:ATP-binding protein [Dongshaea marina]